MSFSTPLGKRQALPASSLSARLMDYRTLAAHLTKFIAQQKEIAGLWNGKDTKGEEEATQAAELIELAQPLLDEPQNLIANE
jgi:hypothetical protein